MQERALKNLVQLPEARRLDAIVEGLGLLVEHVTTLTDDLVYLRDGSRPRGALMLEAQAEEEAAKVLILLDLVRLGWRDPLKVNGQIGRFYQHLSRCIYAEVSKMRPADFAGVRRMVEDMRQAYYLDGPNDVDWIYRNQLLSSREDGLYVDYVQYEDGTAWSTPAGRDVLGFGPDTAVQHLVIALHRLGVTSRRGLEVLVDTWAGQAIEDATPWPVVANLNAQVIAQLDNDGAGLPDATDADSRWASEWTFPLHSLDLTKIDVKVKDLQELRKRSLAARDWSPWSQADTRPTCLAPPSALGGTL
jgi:hypothetical protein